MSADLETGEGEAGGILEIDLGAIRRNYRLLRRQSGRAECAASVKADAYGLGAVPIVQALAREGCRSFFVAHLAEARALLPHLPPEASVFVLNGLVAGAEDAALEPRIVPVLNSLAQVAAWQRAAALVQRRLPAALHVDTGMSRLGLSPDEALGLSSRLDAIDLRLIMSHLSTAEDAAASSNRRELELFSRVREGFPGVAASFANSSGIFLDETFRFEQTRTGAALYGINPTPDRPNPMQPVLRLLARVIQTRSIAPGTPVGYGGAFRAEQPMRVATLGVGYGDGWPRRARLPAFWNNLALPVIGRVSMDTMVLDVSAAPPGAIQPGALVELLNARQTPDELAEATGTIGYEILTSLGRRFYRRLLD